MKKSILLTTICLGIMTSAYCQPVPENIASKIANSWLIKVKQENAIAARESRPVLNPERETLAYIYPLNPQGFIVISGRYELPPVIAYSFTDDLDKEGKLVEIIVRDLTNRRTNLPLTPASEKQKNQAAWDELLTYPSKSPFFQQWPPSGSTSTGGWLETKWTQNAPYNDACPMDPVSGVRSLAGCPAVAMAQIVNYHQTTNNVAFSDADDYHHNYQGRNYWIDDDFDSLAFPSFPDLNTHIYDISNKYQSSTPLGNQDKAALVFACAVAATQVFTSSGSGTFGVSQAQDAYLKFNFNQIELLDANDTSLYSRMAQNMMDSLPVHLAVVNSTWTSGHNIVVDGYNTDDFFHLNFGWGGPSNGWFLLPAQIPYSLNVIEGAIVNIIPNPITGIKQQTEPTVAVFPNPSRDAITFTLSQTGDYRVELYSADGRRVRTAEGNGNLGRFDISSLFPGTYLLKIQTGHSLLNRKIVKL